MDKQSLVKRFETEVATQRERMRQCDEEISRLCQELGIDPGTVSEESLLAEKQRLEAEAAKSDAELERLVSEYERAVAS